jgi:hypothetical protein
MKNAPLSKCNPRAPETMLKAVQYPEGSITGTYNLLKIKQQSPLHRKVTLIEALCQYPQPPPKEAL